MKKNKFTILLIVLIFLFVRESTAGTSAQTRSNCTGLKKYSVSAYAFNYGILIQAQQNGSCTYASAYASASHCSASPNNSAGGFHANPWSDRWWAKGGSAYITPLLPPVDSIGIARCEMGNQTVINAGPVVGTTVVELSNFTGSMVATNSNDYGSTYRIIIWKGLGELTGPQQAFYDGTVRIENGQIITDGFFNASDFIVTTVMDTSGSMVTKIQPVPNLSKSFTLNVDNSDNSVAVNGYGETGFGAYDQFFPYTPTIIPTLNQWGLIVFSLLMLTVILIFLRKGRIA